MLYDRKLSLFFQMKFPYEVQIINYMTYSPTIAKETSKHIVTGKFKYTRSANFLQRLLQIHIYLSLSMTIYYLGHTL